MCILVVDSICEKHVCAGYGRCGVELGTVALLSELFFLLGYIFIWIILPNPNLWILTLQGIQPVYFPLSGLLLGLDM